MEQTAMSEIFLDRATALKRAANGCWIIAVCALGAGIFLSQVAGPWKFVDGGVAIAGWVLGFVFHEHSRRTELLSVAAKEDEDLA